MRLEHDGSKVHIYLSRRNLLALLTKLDHPDSACTLGSEHSDLGYFEVTAESDDFHYIHPGRMIDWTERDITNYD